MRDVVMFDFRCYPFIQGARDLLGPNGGLMKIVWLAVLAVFCSAAFVSADEMVLTTYYPAPNGQYVDMGVAGTLTGNNITMTGGITGATLTASSANPSISLITSGTTNFSVNASGNTVISGTLTAGNTTVNGTLSTTGNVTIGGNLDMTSGSISNVTTLGTSGNVSVGGALSTVGNASIGGNLDMTNGSISNVTTLGTSGNVSVGGALSTVGNASIGGNLDMTNGSISNVTTLGTSGNVSVGGALSTVGNASIGGNLDMTSGAISNVTTLGTSGNVSIGGNLDMTSGAISNVTTLTASGKMYAQTPTSSDPANTVATKGYVDTVAGGGGAYKVYGGFMLAQMEYPPSSVRYENVWGAGTSSGSCTQGSPRLIATLQDWRSSAEWGYVAAGQDTIHGGLYLCVGT